MSDKDPIEVNVGQRMDPLTSGAGIRFLLDPVQETAWAAGVKCTGFTIKHKAGEVTAVIRVVDAKGKCKVAFVTAHSYAAVMEVWLTALHSTSYNLTWHDDRFA